MNEATSRDVYQPATQNRDATAPAILILTTDKVEDLEFFYPYYRFIEAGYRVDVATPEGGEVKGKQGLTLKTTKKLSAINAPDYKLLYIPGGKAPAQLKDNKDVLALVKFFAKSGKLIAAVCHGPQLLAAADVIRGRRIAAWPEVENEVTEAGATYVNEETVCDGPFVTARWPGDLPMHLKQTLAMLDEVSASERPPTKLGINEAA
jgi:protease I